MLIIYDSKAQWLMSQVDESEADVVAYFDRGLIMVIRNNLCRTVGEMSIYQFYSQILVEIPHA